MLVLASALSTFPILTPFVHATVWGPSVALPGTDPNSNLFPNMLQTSNSSAGQGSIWLLCQTTTPSSLGIVYLMTHNRFGWSGQTALVHDNNDNIAPALAELANGTIILVWSRGTGLLGTYDLYWMGYNGTRWTSIRPLVQAPEDNLTPALTRTSDGKIWLVWSRSTPANGMGDIYYKTYDGTWSSETARIATSAMEKTPTVNQMSDGTVWILYDSDAGGNNQIWDTTWNSVSWTAPVRFTSTTNNDGYPSLVQDRSGTLWSFWTRELATPDPNNPFQQDLFYKNSTTLGSSWEAETQVAFSQYTNSDQLHPVVVQSSDKTLWVVYSSNQKISNPYGAFNLYLMQSSPIKGHDVSVTNLKLSINVPFGDLPVVGNPRQGETAQIYVTITNLGDYTESNTTVKLYINSTQVGSTNIPSILAGQTLTYVFNWNSTRYNLAHYTELATISTVPGEILTYNNQLSHTFLLLSPGDVNPDGKVNIVDLSSMGTRFGSVRGTLLYWADADLNHDGKIDIKDLVICALNFGTVG